MSQQDLIQEVELKRPEWIRGKAPNSATYLETSQIVRANGLKTICEEGACPNLGECWGKKHAAFIVLGSVCTRNCKFCNVKTGRPDQLDPHEPERLARAVVELGLSHVVITSVDRDDLGDGGATHFAQCIEHVRKLSPTTTIEVLTPDFLRKNGALEIVMNARPDVFNHNVETVPSLYQSIRPGARYFHSLNLLKRAKELDPLVFTKSGLMLGLGETDAEILQVMDDMRAAEIDFLTIGQYLRPTPKHAPVMRYGTPEEFEYLARMARCKGFLLVSSSPMTRSSYHADEDFKKLKAARAAS